MGHWLLIALEDGIVASALTLLSVVFTSARLVVAIVFLVAGLPKVVAGNGLAKALRALGVERRGTLLALRVVVPIAELSLGIWLLMGLYPVAACFVAAAILTTFTSALLQLRERKLGGCGCFVWNEDSVAVADLVRNLILIFTAGTVGIVTLLGWYKWTPVWRLAAHSALVIAPCVAFVFLLYTLIARSLRLMRDMAVDS